MEEGFILPHVILNDGMLSNIAFEVVALCRATVEDASEFIDAFLTHCSDELVVQFSFQYVCKDFMNSCTSIIKLSADESHQRTFG